MTPKLPLPRGWKRRLGSALSVHIGPQLTRKRRFVALSAFEEPAVF